jgi:hypothetical protein
MFFHVSSWCSRGLQQVHHTGSSVNCSSNAIRPGTSFLGNRIFLAIPKHHKLFLPAFNRVIHSKSNHHFPIVALDTLFESEFTNLSCLWKYKAVHILFFPDLNLKFPLDFPDLSISPSKFETHAVYNSFWPLPIVPSGKQEVWFMLMEILLVTKYPILNQRWRIFLGNLSPGSE